MSRWLAKIRSRYSTDSFQSPGVDYWAARGDLSSSVATKVTCREAPESHRTRARFDRRYPTLRCRSSLGRFRLWLYEVRVSSPCRFVGSRLVDARGPTAPISTWSV